MADVESMRRALDAHCDALLELELFVKACEEAALAVDDTGPRPAWLFVAGRQIDRARASGEDLERRIRQQVLPLLEAGHGA